LDGHSTISARSRTTSPKPRHTTPTCHPEYNKSFATPRRPSRRALE
jgi:hypothetical protein